MNCKHCGNKIFEVGIGSFDHLKGSKNYCDNPEPKDNEPCIPTREDLED